MTDAPFPVIERADAAQAGAIEDLVTGAGLEPDGLAVLAASGNVLVARADDGCLVGTVALEWHDDAVLLRSLAVTAGARGHGLGSALVERALHLAREGGTPEAWLLTETAEPFFAARGWTVAERAAAPAGIAASAQFAGGCPQTARAMRRTL